MPYKDRLKKNSVERERYHKNKAKLDNLIKIKKPEPIVQTDILFSDDDDDDSVPETVPIPVPKSVPEIKSTAISMPRFVFYH